MDHDVSPKKTAGPAALPAQSPELIDAIVDAVCQGRLTPAEVAGLTAQELDALYALGSARLHTGQLEQAVVLYAALVSLDPYQAKAWRALGISHHHVGAMHEAARAYGAALFLEPDHALTAAYALEVHLVLGDTRRAEHLARRVAQSDDADALGRLARLWGPQKSHAPPSAPIAPPQDAARPPAAAPRDEAAPENAFCLADGRTLPLGDSVFAPAGESDETTLVYDLAQLNRAGAHAASAPAEPPPHGDAVAPEGLEPPLLAPSTPSFVHPKERTLTGAAAHSFRVLPEATAARRMGLMLTEEITRAPENAAYEEATEPAGAVPPQNKGAR